MSRINIVVLALHKHNNLLNINIFLVLIEDIKLIVNHEDQVSKTFFRNIFSYLYFIFIAIYINVTYMDIYRVSHTQVE